MIRTPPHSHESEQGVLGCILLSPMDCVGKCVEAIGGDLEAFYDLRHRTIYETIVKMADERVPLDLITIQQRLKDMGVLDQVGGIYYLDELQDSVASTANLPTYLETVLEKRTLRKVISTCTEHLEKVYNHACTTDEFIDGFEKSALAIRSCKKQESDIKSLTLEAIADLEARMASDTILGVSTELTDLDSKTDGLHSGELIVIAGFPSTGKTALAGNIAFDAALRGIPSAFFSAEMSPSKIVSRAMFSHARVNKRFVTENDCPKLTHSAGKISHAPIVIERAIDMSVSQIAAVCRRIKQKQGLKIVVVDYIQLISGSGDNREQEIASVSRGLKSISMELNCCVLALSQLNDDGKLRESRAIGQDADSVWKLMNNGEWEPKVQPIKLMIEKSRDGETGVVDLIFMKEWTRFVTASKVRDEDVPKQKKK